MTWGQGEEKREGEREEAACYMFVLMNLRRARLSVCMPQLVTFPEPPLHLGINHTASHPQVFEELSAWLCCLCLFPSQGPPSFCLCFAIASSHPSNLGVLRLLLLSTSSVAKDSQLCHGFLSQPSTGHFLFSSPNLTALLYFSPRFPATC